MSVAISVLAPCVSLTCAPSARPCTRTFKAVKPELLPPPELLLELELELDELELVDALLEDEAPFSPPPPPPPQAVSSNSEASRFRLETIPGARLGRFFIGARGALSGGAV
ncbi:hypothetical protein GCM10027046_37180 [Uliginosibacterium flavum]